MPEFPGRSRLRARIVSAVALAAAAVFGLVFLEGWWVQDARQDAFRRLSRRDFEGARSRLSRVLAWRWGDGEAWFHLGCCESALGDESAARAAWDSVPIGSPFAARAAIRRARQELAVHRLGEAEPYLRRSLDGRGPHAVEAFETLLHLFKIEGRFREARRLVVDRWEAYPDRVGILRELTQLEMPSPYPPAKAREALDRAGEAAPEDDRVWLGEANLALRTGDLEAARRWLESCERRRSADDAVLRARIALAEATGDGLALRRATERLAPEALDLDELLRLRAGLAAESGDRPAERDALRQLLSIRVDDAKSLERLAELEILAGRADESARLRERKAELDRARWRFETLLFLTRPQDNAREMGRLAESLGRSVEARICWTIVLDGAPGDAEARASLARLVSPGRPSVVEEDRRPVLLSELAHAAAGADPDGAAGAKADARRATRFDDDASSSGLTFRFDAGTSTERQLPETMGGGVALLDFDGDGWLDVYCVQGGPFPPSPDSKGGDRLYRNRGDGTFEDATERSGVDRLTRGYGHGAAVGDYDGDGRPDLFLTRWRSYALLRNRGDGTFEDATEAAGLGGDRGWPTSAAWADLDGDGDLDLYVVHYLKWDAEHPHVCAHRSRPGAFEYCYPQKFLAEADHLFRNDGGRFHDATAEAGIVDRDGRGLGVAAADLDDDGRVDLFVANDTTANYLFRNLGGMKFEEVGDAAGVAGNASGGYQASMGVACGDLDGDGDLDLAVTNFLNESMTYYSNLGGGMFVDHTANVGLLVPTRDVLGFGTSFLDADNDGRLDLAVANGHVNDLRPESAYAMPGQLFLGGEGGRLVDVSSCSGGAWTTPRVGRGLAVGDLDNDGRQDVIVLSQNGPLAYLHNRSEAGGAIVLELEGAGAASPRDAVGARVTIEAGGRRLVRYKHGGGSYQSSSDPRLYFGLGEARVADRVEVRWPSGRSDSHKGLASGARYRIREGAARPERLAPLAR